MIRIISRDPAGNPTGHADYLTLQPDQVSVLAGMQFDKDLVELADAGYDLGVTRWAEAVWVVKGFSAQSYYKLQELQRSLDPGNVDNAELLDAIAEQPTFIEWMQTHPDYRLARTVTIWAAVNMAGVRMSLLEVLALAPADVQDYEGNDFLPDEVASGKG